MELLKHEIASSAVNRIDVLLDALRLFVEHPAGVGFGESKYFIGKGLGLGLKSAHNVLYSMGIRMRGFRVDCMCVADLSAGQISVAGGESVC